MAKDEQANDTEATASENSLSADTDSQPALHLPRASCVGRYIISDVLGQGGMGVVYRAFDPDLNRPVALKMMKVKKKAGQGMEPGGTTQARLLREAQALAQLSHPNVVAVHDVGTYEDMVFIAMELVEGQTLDQWLRKEKRSVVEIMAVMVAAGRGLAAAHKVGIIHRDFKPANVMVGRDRRVRVLDFGLARGIDLTPAEGVPAILPAGDQEDQGEESAAQAGLEFTESAGLSASFNYLTSSLTQFGKVMGTLNYMAPEQFLHWPLDERSDQFSFCVVLFKALHGARPYRGRDSQKLVINMRLGRVVPPKKQEIPDWMMDVILRGLHYRQVKRFDSMDQLLAALGNDPAQLLLAARRVRRRRLLMTVGVLFFLLSVGFGLWYGQHQTSRLCRGAEEKLRGVWDDAVRAKIKVAFLSTGRSYAQDTFVRVERVLDDFGQAWVQGWRQACEATRVSGEQSEQVLDLRMHCLHRRLSALRSLTELLAGRADAEVMSKAVPAAFSLIRVASCENTAALRAAVAPPQDPRMLAEVEAIRHNLDEVYAHLEMGKYAQGIRLAKEVLPAARAAQYLPLMGEAWLRLGQAQERSGQYHEAEASLKKASEIALQAKDRRTAIEAMIAEIWVLGEAQARYQESLALRRVVETAMALGEEDDDLRADLHSRLGVVFFRKREHQRAIDHHQDAIDILTRTRGPAHPHVARSLANLGNVYFSQGKYQQAIVFHQRALAIWQKALGPQHPDLAVSLSNLGVVFKNQGRYQKAKDYFEQALAIDVNSQGPEHPLVAFPLNNLGMVHIDLGNLDLATNYLQRARSIWEKSLGPAHPNVAIALHNLGTIYLKQGRLGKAREAHQRALAVREKALGPDHPVNSWSLCSLGLLNLRENKVDRAQQQFERVLTICGQNNCQGEEREPLSEAKFSLARLLWQSGEDRPRALSLVAEALALFKQQYSNAAKELQRQAQDWLDQRGV